MATEYVRRLSTVIAAGATAIAVSDVSQTFASIGAVGAATRLVGSGECSPRVDRAQTRSRDVWAPATAEATRMSVSRGLGQTLSRFRENQPLI